MKMHLDFSFPFPPRGETNQPTELLWLLPSILATNAMKCLLCVFPPPEKDLPVETAEGKSFGGEKKKKGGNRREGLQGDEQQTRRESKKKQNKTKEGK